MSAPSCDWCRLQQLERGVEASTAEAAALQEGLAGVAEYRAALDVASQQVWVDRMGSSSNGCCWPRWKRSAGRRSPETPARGHVEPGRKPWCLLHSRLMPLPSLVCSLLLQMALVLEMLQKDVEGIK